MSYKFEDLEVWQNALDYADTIHDIANELPKHERYNLADQMTRAANSIALNVAAQDYFFASLRARKDPPASATPNRTVSSALRSAPCSKPSPPSIS